MSYTIEYGDCDEAQHGRCAGMDSQTVAEATGYPTEAEAFTAALDVLARALTVARLVEQPHTASLLSRAADPEAVVIRDYVIYADDCTPVNGGHHGEERR